MKEFLRESIIDCFNDGLVTVKEGDFVRTPVTGVKLHRNDELELIFELTSSGWCKERPEHYPAGTVRSADEIIEFRHAAGWVGIASGVIALCERSNSKSTEQAVTVETYSAHSVDLNLQRQVLSSYVIEWVSNIPDGLIWTEPVRFDIVETFTKSVGSGNGEIRMTTSSSTAAGVNKALHLKISGVDLYIMKPIDANATDRNAGQIVYRGCPDQTFRDKVRACISFILGRPIVYHGHTEYCSEWKPTLLRSVGAFSINNAAFRLHDLPPYPINDPLYENVIDQELVNHGVNALLDKFDAIKFNELSWSYWYAVCAPTHAAAVHFGSLIEQLQNNYNKSIGMKFGQLLDNASWKLLKPRILSFLDEETINSDVLKILTRKVCSLNQAPQNIILNQILTYMNLSISDAEMKAWRTRNMAAHGTIRDNHIDIILNSKLLKLTFHRMVAGITSCSDKYVDYYSYGFPVRPLTEAVPRR